MLKCRDDAFTSLIALTHGGRLQLNLSDYLGECGDGLECEAHVRKPMSLLADHCISGYSNDHFSAKIEPPMCWHYKRGNFQVVRPLNGDEIPDKDDDDENSADPGAPCRECSRLGDGTDNDDGKCEKNTQDGEKVTGDGYGTMDRKGKGKATEEGKGNRMVKVEGICIVEQTPGGDDISRPIALQLQKEMYEADSNTEG